MSDAIEIQARNFIDRQISTTWKALPGTPEIGSLDSRGGLDVAFTARWAVPLWYSDADPGTDPDSDLYKLKIEYHLGVNRRGDRMAVRRSKYSITVGNAPALRYEYEAGNTSAPMAHIHIHGVGGLLSPGLMRNAQSSREREKRKGDWQALHLPVGGARYRPSLEEFLYFTIRECGFRGRDGGLKYLEQQRDLWRRSQVEPVVRDYPDEAVDALRGLGYRIERPHGQVDTPGPHDKW